jgi:hypothetical protein
MSKYGARIAILNAHYGFGFINSNATRSVSESEKEGIKRMRKKVKNTGSLNESRIIRIHSLDESKVVRIVKHLLKTHNRQ